MTAGKGVYGVLIKKAAQKWAAQVEKVLNALST
jgi:hypothetical protein